ncbi:MAG TPA: hypothetical protein VKP69_15565 [Isosphaeraceae bacterium]|nr:hypothetical protein [Isosphaeraceae bacterium]
MMVLAGIMMTAPAPATAAAPRAVEVEGLRVGFTSNARGNLFKLGTWTPVWVQLRAGAERFAGVMEVIVPDDDGTPTAFRQFVDVAPHTSERFTTYARPGSADPDFTIRLLDRRGRRRAPDVSGASVVKLDPIRPDEMLLITLGRPQGVEMIPSLPSFTPDPNNNPGRVGPELTVARIDPLSDTLPGRWYGFDAAEAIVLDTNDRDVMAKLNATGGQAIREWVRRGGHLVVAVGSDWSRVRDSFLRLKDDPMLPATPTGRERVHDLGGLESFAGASRPIAPAGSATAVLVTTLEEVEARGGKVLSAAGPVPLVVRGPYGFGRVTVVALDVDQKPFSDWPDRPLFWVKALDLRRRGGADPNAPGAVVVAGRGRFYQSGVTDLSSLLRRALEQFSAVRLVPFGWVAFLIFLYILLIGPGDYLFLKRVLKRMELTWITFPIIVVTVSLLAYYAAYLVKGRELRVNKVDVVDLDQATGQARGSVWMNLFSPQDRDYGVAVIPQPLDRDSPAGTVAKGEGSAGPVRPPAGTEVVTTWFGVPGPGFGGMGYGSRLSLSGGGYAYEPIGGAERLDGIRVPIWSTKCLTARWIGPAAPLVEADLQPAGPDRLSGTIINRQSVPLKEALLAFGKQAYELKTIAPGATVRVELSQDRSLSGFLKSKAPSYVANQPDLAEDFQLDRANLMLALMFHDSESSVAGPGETALASVPLHYLDLTGQLALGRPMLVALYDRAPTRLALDNAPGAPVITQTTLVRVILPLPLGKPQADEEKGR